jgi:hypothetical protein
VEKRCRRGGRNSVTEKIISFKVEAVKTRVTEIEAGRVSKPDHPAKEKNG